MADALYLIAAFALTYLAFACFALVQPRHWQAATGTHDCALSGKRLLKIGGIVGLATGCGIALWHEGPAYGPLLWVTQLIVAAFATVVTLSLRPRFFTPLVILFTHASADGPPAWPATAIVPLKLAPGVTAHPKETNHA